jgi:hypothetical protein
MVSNADADRQIHADPYTDFSATSLLSLFSNFYFNYFSKTKKFAEVDTVG